MNPKVKIFILNWNGGKLLLECISSVAKINYENLDIIVIDNASTDNSIRNIHKNFPDVDIISLDKNYGYSKAYNKAFNFTDYQNNEFFMLLNNDTIVDQDIVNYFFEAYKSLDSEKYIFGPKIYYMDKKKIIWYAGGKINFIKGIIKHIGIRKKDNQKYNNISKTDYITGCCMFTHSNNMKELNGFDERFNMYCEDVDLSLRALSLNIKCIYVPKAILWHKVSHSFKSEFSKKKFLLKFSSLLKLYNKHLPWYIVFIAFDLFLIRSLINGIKLFFHRLNNRLN